MKLEDMLKLDNTTDTHNSTLSNLQYLQSIGTPGSCDYYIQGIDALHCRQLEHDA